MPIDSIEAAYATITKFSIPNPMQRAAWRQIVGSPGGTGLLLKGPTGSGKTEAVAIPGLADDRRLIMIYPARSLVDDQISRFQKMLAQLSAARPVRPYSLVVDTGATSYRYLWSGGDEKSVPRNPYRHLYHGDVIVTTLDKFLYRFFGFGEPGKSYTYPLRIRHGLRKTLLCFDEAHSYDDVAFTNFAKLVRSLYVHGLDIVLMTATMPPDFVAEFDYLDTHDFVEDDANRTALAAFYQRCFPKRQYPDRSLEFVPCELEEIPARLMELAIRQYDPNRRMIVTAERVKDAVAIWQELHETLPQVKPLLYHGRLTAERRRYVYNQLREIEKQGGGYLLVTTSAIEVGCDLDAHVLLTQLCDPERLIQRAGRCNRRQEIPDARVIVVGDTIPEWLTNLKPDDLNLYVAELQAQHNNGYLDTIAMSRCIRKQTLSDHRIEILFDMLYEYVYEAKTENRGLHRKGLVVTRSWEPSLTLCTGEDDTGFQNAVQVPMRSCVAKKGDPISSLWIVSKRTFDWQERKPTLGPLGRWECAYAVDLIACPQFADFDEEVGWVDLPHLFKWASRRSAYRRILVREEDGKECKLWYISPLEDSMSTADIASQLGIEDRNSDADQRGED